MIKKIRCVMECDIKVSECGEFCSHDCEQTNPAITPECRYWFRKMSTDNVRWHRTDWCKQNEITE